MNLLNKIILKLSTWVIPKDVKDELTEDLPNLKGNMINILSESSNKSKSFVISLLLIRAIYYLLLLSMLGYEFYFLIVLITFNVPGANMAFPLYENNMI